MRIRRHKARQDVRLAEVAEAPAQQRNHRDEVQPLQHIEVLNALRLDDRQRVVQSANGDNHDHRRQDQRENHQGCLHGIGPAHRKKAAHQRIEDGRRRAGPQRSFIAHAEGAFKQARARHYARGAVDGEEDQDHQRRDNAQDFTFIFEAAGEKVGQRQGVIMMLGLYAQTPRHDLPVQPGADRQPDGDPAFRNAGEKNRARQPHQQPAAHIRGARRQRGHKTTKAAAAQNVIVEVFGGTVGDEAYQHHPKDINYKSHQHRCAYTHSSLHFIVDFPRETARCGRVGTGRGRRFFPDSGACSFLRRGILPERRDAHNGFNTGITAISPVKR